MSDNVTDDLKASALAYHRLPKPGKLAIQATKPLATQHDLALAYTPASLSPVSPSPPILRKRPR